MASREKYKATDAEEEAGKQLLLKKDKKGDVPVAFKDYQTDKDGVVADIKQADAGMFFNDL